MKTSNQDDSYKQCLSQIYDKITQIQSKLNQMEGQNDPERKENLNDSL